MKQSRYISFDSSEIEFCSNAGIYDHFSLYLKKNNIKIKAYNVCMQPNILMADPLKSSIQFNSYKIHVYTLSCFKSRIRLIQL